MKNIYTFFILCLFLINGCTTTPLNDVEKTNVSDIINSNKIPLSEARELLEEFLDEIDTPLTRANGRKRVISDYFIVGENTVTRSGNDVMVYVFNFANEEGFAIIAGDRRMDARILAVTESGYLDPEVGVDCPAVTAVLTNIENAYNAASSFEPGIPSGTVEYSAWTHKNYGRRTYLNWNQWNPYNTYSPVINGKKAPAGCTATALALVMAYHMYPRYYGNYSFMWENMVRHERTDVYESCGVGVHDMIGRLFEQISLPENLDMNFGETASGAYLTNIVRTLTNMGYKSPGEFMDYDYDKVKAQLTRNMGPIPVSAYAFEHTRTKVLGITIAEPTKARYSKGHSFVVESLRLRERTMTVRMASGTVFSSKQTDELLFCVMGGESWSYNGYYYSGAFDLTKPPVSNSRTNGEENNFQYNIQMVLGINGFL